MYVYTYILLLLLLTQIQRFTGWLRPAGPSGGPCSSRNTHSRVPSTTSWQLLKISEEDTPHSLSGQLMPGLLSLTIHKCLLVFRGNLLSSIASGPVTVYH